MALGLLDHNKVNRPLSDAHVQRIARQIADGKWRFNGDTIKISADGDILDGQHRLWAVCEAKKSVETLIVYGVERDAFATVDTIKKPRSGADILSLCGLTRHTRNTATALTWLLRYQRGVLPNYRDAANRIENSDIEAAYRNHPHMVEAVDRATKVRRLVNPALLGFFYYILYSSNAELAERMMATLESPAGVSMHDPFYRLREWFLSIIERDKSRDPIAVIGLMIKMANAAANGQQVRAALYWRNLERQKDGFPTLKTAARKDKGAGP